MQLFNFISAKELKFKCNSCKYSVNYIVITDTNYFILTNMYKNEI